MYTPSPLLALRFTRYRYTVAPFLSHSNSVTMPAALQVELNLPISHPASTFTPCSVHASLATFICICVALLFRHNHRPSLLGNLTPPLYLVAPLLLAPFLRMHYKTISHASPLPRAYPRRSMPAKTFFRSPCFLSLLHCIGGRCESKHRPRWRRGGIIPRARLLRGPYSWT